MLQKFGSSIKSSQWILLSIYCVWRGLSKYSNRSKTLVLYFDSKFTQSQMFLQAISTFLLLVSAFSMEGNVTYHPITIYIFFVIFYISRCEFFEGVFVLSLWGR